MGCKNRDILIGISSIRYRITVETTINSKEIIMKKNPFKDLQTTDGILYVWYIIAKIVIALSIIGSVVGGIIMCVNLSVMYGCFVLFGGVLGGIIEYALAWSAKTVCRCFYDAACATKEMYEKNNPEETIKSGDDFGEEENYVIYNEKTNTYTSDLDDKRLLFCNDEDDAMIFDDVKEAQRLMLAYELNRQDGWTIKRIKM